MMSVNLNDIAILKINRATLYCSINEDSKSDAVNLLQNVNLTKEKGVLQKFKNQKIFTIYKMGEKIITFGDIKVKNTNFTT